MAYISRASEEIFKIINSFEFQTNFFALNASVERDFKLVLVQCGNPIPKGQLKILRF
jgi:hypothetical protein